MQFGEMGVVVANSSKPPSGRYWGEVILTSLGKCSFLCDLGKGSNNQNGNLRWLLPGRGGGVSRGSRVPHTSFEK